MDLHESATGLDAGIAVLAHWIVSDALLYMGETGDSGKAGPAALGAAYEQELHESANASIHSCFARRANVRLQLRCRLFAMGYRLWAMQCGTGGLTVQSLVWQWLAAREEGIAQRRVHCGRAGGLVGTDSGGMTVEGD